jgi:hypothetical protein
MKLATIPLCAALTLLLPGCGGLGGPAGARLESASDNIDWRAIATQSDRTRLREWRTAWMEGLRKAEAAGHGAEVASEGALLQPDSALAWENPPTGDYQCRVLKIGAKSQGLLDYVAYPAFNCRIRAEDGLMSFAKLTGSQRPLGMFLPDSSRRMVFLGTLQLGDERLALEYGRDRERDMAGVVERVGEHRWRLVFPYPHFESTVDVLELVPRG